MFHFKCIKIFKECFSQKIEKNYKLEYRESQNGDFGNLQTVEFNSNEKGGYIDFWSLGCISYQIVDYIKEIEILEDTLVEDVSVEAAKEIMDKVCSKL